MNKTTLAGTLAAFVCILVWGTTFVSTKVLLRSFLPVEILFIRFFIGYGALWAVCPRRLALNERGQERYFVFAGLTGVTLYFLLENIALTYTLASNVGVIIAIAPFFTALISWLFCGGERPGPRFLAGLCVALSGVALLSFGGGSALRLNPRGDLLAFAAAVVWAIYSNITKRIGSMGYPVIQSTRRAFFYGLLFMAPTLPILGFRLEFGRLLVPVNFGNLLFLGLGASAICFAAWSFAVRALGPVKTSVSIYLTPVITAFFSALILHEEIGRTGLFGIALTLAGLFLSESGPRKKTAGA